MVTQVNTLTEANKALARRFYEEGWNQGHLAIFDGLLASNHDLHDAGFPEPIRGPEGFKQYYASYRTDWQAGDGDWDHDQSYR